MGVTKMLVQYTFHKVQTQEQGKKRILHVEFIPDKCCRVLPPDGHTGLWMVEQCEMVRGKKPLSNNSSEEGATPEALPVRAAETGCCWRAPCWTFPEASY